jgi:hypothetical protein
MRLSVAFSKKKILTRSLKATASQRIEISRKEQKEQKNNKCQPYQKFVIPDRSLTGSGIQGNALKNPGHDPISKKWGSCPRIQMQTPNTLIAWLACAP